MAFGFSLKMPRPRANGANACTIDELDDIVTKLRAVEEAIERLTDPSRNDIPLGQGLEDLKKLYRDYETLTKRLYECVATLEPQDSVLERVRSKIPL